MTIINSGDLIPGCMCRPILLISDWVSGCKCGNSCEWHKANSDSSMSCCQFGETATCFNLCLTSLAPNLTVPRNQKHHSDIPGLSIECLTT